ncbi:putative neprosin activation peptide [Medicago truncatula]|uniref:Putative neprosin activation peptide n=1 Tax=Medicago truncatula TaxID=3880 RepID=A0A396HYV3_MEDTR|nr:putative neprosin activation peptide [Medicago truncatula]
MLSFFFHLLHRQPNFSIKKEKTSAKISPTDKITCPTRTVPIRRTTKDDLIRAKSLWNNNILANNARFAPVIF